LLIGLLAFLMLLAGLAVGAIAIGFSRTDTVVIPLEPQAGVPAETSSGSPGQPQAVSQAESPPEWMTEYTLTERSGRKFHSRELAGKVHVVNFFFTACPTVCRMQTAAVQSLAKEFGPEGVVFLSITCDPENDDPVALSLYARQFEADAEDWLFLTGEMAYLRRVGAEVYFVAVDRGTHSESLLVLDKRGKIRGRFSWKRPEELAELKKRLAELQAEPAGT
jgi:cytochrome oxidase Cu insertion factor (SCO1/SenC/PrrC family)